MGSCVLPESGAENRVQVPERAVHAFTAKSSLQPQVYHFLRLHLPNLGNHCFSLTHKYVIIINNNRGK